MKIIGKKEEFVKSGGIIFDIQPIYLFKNIISVVCLIVAVCRRKIFRNQEESEEDNLEYVLLIAGFVLLIKGADFFVDGSASVAHKMRISSMVIGLTVVAMGTSVRSALQRLSGEIMLWQSAMRLVLISLIC